MPLTSCFSICSKIAKPVPIHHLHTARCAFTPLTMFHTPCMIVSKSFSSSSVGHRSPLSPYCGRVSSCSSSPLYLATESLFSHILLRIQNQKHLLSSPGHVFVATATATSLATNLLAFALSTQVIETPPPTERYDSSLQHRNRSTDHSAMRSLQLLQISLLAKFRGEAMRF